MKYSFDNDQLYRGDKKEFDFCLHNTIEREQKGITYRTYFIGVGGGNEKEMIKI